VTNRGLLSPGGSPGQLTVTGNLTLISTSQLLIELGGISQGVNYDFLSVTGTAALDGTLQLTFVNNFQSTIPANATFTVLTASSLSGSFSNVATSGLRITTTDGFGSFQVNFGTGSAFAANSIVLSNFVAIPEPSTWVLLTSGTLLLAFNLRRRRR
jgi:hypothetical protein